MASEIAFDVRWQHNISKIKLKTVNFGKTDNEIVGPLFLQHFHFVPYTRRAHAFHPFSIIAIDMDIGYWISS